MGTTVRWRVRRFIAAFLFLPAVAFPQDREIVSMPAGECTLTVEANERWHALRLRVRPETGCRVEKEPMLSVLKGAFSKTGPPGMEGPYSSLSIGRLIDTAWLSRYLADEAARDAGWDRKRGKPAGMDINRYVSNLLSRKEVTAPVEEAMAGSGYRVVSVTVEKVLVDRASRLPFDAQVWFNLEKD